MCFAGRGMKPRPATKGCFLCNPHSIGSPGKPGVYLGIKSYAVRGQIEIPAVLTLHTQAQL